MQARRKQLLQPKPSKAQYTNEPVELQFEKLSIGNPFAQDVIKQSQAPTQVESNSTSKSKQI